MYGIILKGTECRGSFTIEAALLMTIIIPVLTGLIYLGIYEHDKAWLLNKAQTAAAELTAYEKDFNTIKWNGVIGGETVSGNVSRGKNKVQAEVRGSFPVPGLVMRFFAGGKLSLNYSAEKPVIMAKKEIQRLRNLERLKAGAGK